MQNELINKISFYLWLDQTALYIYLKDKADYWIKGVCNE